MWTGLQDSPWSEGHSQYREEARPGWEMPHSILLLLPDPNWMDPTYSQRAKRASGPDHGCHQAGEGRRGRKDGERACRGIPGWHIGSTGYHLLPFTIKVLNFINSHRTISENAIYLTVGGSSALWKGSILMAGAALVMPTCWVSALGAGDMILDFSVFTKSP